MSFRVDLAGRAALGALRGGRARVFASFERSCYVETPAGMACLGGPGLGMGPLNAIAERFEALPVGAVVELEIARTRAWTPPARAARLEAAEIEIPRFIREPAVAFLDWICGDGEPDDALIGLGPGLTPAGDDFVGGAMIALRAFGDDAAADHIAGWALPLARTNTNRISRAHLECAARGEGHEALHSFLASSDPRHLERLARIGHTSGMDAAAGALAALSTRSALHGVPVRRALGAPLLGWDKMQKRGTQ